MLRKNNLRTKLIFSYAAIILVSFFVITLFFYFYVQQSVRGSMKENIVEVANSVSNQLDSEIANLDRIALGILGNKDFTDALTSLNNRPAHHSSLSLEEYEFQNLVDRLIFTLNTPVFISPMVSVFQPEKGYFFGWSIDGLDQPRIGEVLENIPWQEPVRQQAGARVILPPRQNEGSRQEDLVFSVARAVMTSTGQYLGTLEVQQNFSNIEDICAPVGDARYTVVTDEKGAVIYPLESEEVQPVIEKVQALSQPQGNLFLGGTTYFYSSTTSEYSGWKTTVLWPQEEIYHSTALLFQFILYALVVILVLSLTAVTIISQNLTTPLRKLRQSIEATDADRLDLSLELENNDDEIQLLQQAFEGMLARIDLSIQQRTQMQEEETKARLLALQSQMNPHFLYNTLNTIAALADEKEQPEIEQSCRYLVDMLRYVVDYDNPLVTLEQEIDHTQKYLALMQTRYESNLSFSIEVSGNPASVMVPRLILQPLVENCYKHGLCAVCPPWEILVEISIASQWITIRVMDNGCGFSPQILEQLRRRISTFSADGQMLAQLKESRPDNVGLLNTYSRLYLRYRGRIRMELANRLPRGSVVTIVLPAESNPAPQEEVL